VLAENRENSGQDRGQREKGLGKKASPEDKLLGRDFTLICLINSLAFFSIYLIVPVLPLFLEEQGYSNALIGFLMAIATIAALMRPLFGRMADLRGRKIILLAGTLLLGISTFFYISFTSALPLFFIRLLNGLGLAAFHTAAYAIIGDLAPTARRLQAIAIFYISVDITIAIAPIVAENMEAAWGYNFVYFLAGCLAMLAFLCSLLVRETRGEKQQAESVKRSRIKITPLQSAIYITTMGFTLVFGMLQWFIILSSEARGIEEGAWFFTVFAVTLIVFRLGVGRKADRWPRRPLIISSAFISLGGLVLIAYAGNLPVLLLASFVFALGFAYLPTTLSALLLDHTSLRDRGAALGIFMTVFDIGILIGGVALGPLADLWGYTAMYLCGGALALMTLVFFVLRTVHVPESEGE
jgi:MFS family permease